MKRLRRRAGFRYHASSEVMRVSVEAFLVLNLLADAALIASVSRAMGLFNPKRVILASVLCAVYAVLAASRPEVWKRPVIQTALLAAVAALLCFGVSARLMGTTALSLGMAALLAGGAAWLMPLRGVSAALPCALSAGLVTTLLFAARPPRASACHARVRLDVDGRTARFDALIDTGNCLREPISGLPVLIAEAALLRKVLPAEGFRELRFGAIGGSGSMRCFKPTSVWIERGRYFRRVPDLWVAVSPTPLPGRHRALAPCEFMDYI